MRRPGSILNEPAKLTTSLSALKTLPRFFKEIWNASRKHFLLNLAARIVHAFIPVFLLWVGKLIIDEIILQVAHPEQDLTRLWEYVAFELLLALASDLLSRSIALTDGILGDLYSNISSIKIIRKTSELEIAQLEDPDFYDKLEQARTQTNGRVILMSDTLTQAENLVSTFSLIAGLVYFEPLLILLLFLSIIPAFINEIKFSNQRYSLVRSWTAERRELDYLRYIGANDKTAKEIKLFGLSGYVADRFDRISRDYFQLNKGLSVRQAGFGAFFNFLGVATYYGAYIFIIMQVLAGAITVGELTFLSGSFNRLRTNLQGVFTRFSRISESAMYLKDYFEFIDLKPEEKSTEELPVPDKISKGFEIDHLSFRYPGSEEYVLEDVSFTIRPGEKMAFVGMNGAGKTTLIKLILRFYEPTGGFIRLEDTDIRRFDKAAYQQMFGVIFQDFFRYEFTLKENIAVGNIRELDNDALIENAADRSLAAEVASEMSKGYHQQLGRRFVNGQELSGGQWQKVALARAYMKDAPVMVLDEPTSALDARAEYEVFERFIALTKGKTSIIISHRFSTVRMADRILVLQDGKVLELGTHEELLAHPKLYAELFELQAAGYK